MRNIHLKHHAIFYALLAGLVPLAIGAVVSNARSDAPAHVPQFAKPEPGEQFPGGTATTRKSPKHRDVFSQSSRGVSFEGESRFKIGNAIFRKLWVSSPASTKSSDGLGPLYNARGCQNCHFKDGRGHPPSANWPIDDAISMFLRLSIPPQTDAHKKLLASHRANVINEPTYGGQLQDLAIQGLDGEARMHITYDDVPVTLSDGVVVTLRHPTYKITDLKYGPLHPDTMTSPRVAPQMIGLGLLEAIPEQAIRANADPDDADGNGISGRTNEVWSIEKNRVTLGRFGWKAGAPSVAEQSAGAFAGDIGLSSPLMPGGSGDCTSAQVKCINAPNGNTPSGGTPPGDGHEVSQQLLDFVVFYSQNLAVPKRRDFNAPEVLRGKKVFHDLGCASCHRPSFTTGLADGQKHLSNQKIWPYSDLLLHDMGDGLSDGRPEGVATGKEWRTAPLWGIGLTKVVSGHTFFLHDGRARNITEAILWHGGEAQPARDAFKALSKADRETLLRFVNSL